VGAGVCRSRWELAGVGVGVGVGFSAGVGAGVGTRSGTPPTVVGLFTKPPPIHQFCYMVSRR
jgi:hypothetical protein